MTKHLRYTYITLIWACASKVVWVEKWVWLRPTQWYKPNGCALCVCVFCVCVVHVQNLVTQRWQSVSMEEKVELRHFLMHHVVSNHASLPSFLSKKVVRVVVLIGRTDWPQHYPDFISHIQQVGGGEGRHVQGLT